MGNVGLTLRAWLAPGVFGRLLRMAALAVACAATVARAEAPAQLRIYVDADFTHTEAVGTGIALGIAVALDLAGRGDAIKVLLQDHRGNSRRSFDTMRAAASDDATVAVFGGMQSPPYLTFNNDINLLGVPVLLPWSAGAPITRRVDSDRNWMFRVSVDDSKASGFLAAHARRAGCIRAGIVVVDTPWGIGNAYAVQDALARGGLNSAGIWRAPPAAGPVQTARIVAQLTEHRIDCVMLFGDSDLSKRLVAALASEQRPPRVVSHWGIYGDARLHEVLRVPLARVDLRVLGTCVVAREGGRAAEWARADASLRRLTEGAQRLDALHAPHAFFHAHDATLLLLEALDAARTDPGWHRDARSRRRAIRAALYALDRPVKGLVRTYRAPFSPVSALSPDGHEALGEADLCMHRFDAMGRLRAMAEPADGSGSSMANTLP